MKYKYIVLYVKVHYDIKLKNFKTNMKYKGYKN